MSSYKRNHRHFCIKTAQSFHAARNIYRPGGLCFVGPHREGREMEPHSRISDNIDIHKTSRSVCDEVGERLQQDLSLEASPLPPYLDRLIDELRKQDKLIA
jgi:hypothetical protein